MCEFVEEDAPASSRYEKLINIQDRGQIFRVDVDTIERIDAAGDYMCIYTADNSLILRETMKDLEKRLDPRNFQRVHRSTIVNLSQVKQVKPHTNGECFLVLGRSEEHTSELQSLMRISYAFFCLKKKNQNNIIIVLFVIVLY